LEAFDEHCEAFKEITRIFEDIFREMEVSTSYLRFFLKEYKAF
jgi:hypothetical protein